MTGPHETAAEAEFPRPRILLSECLELSACRYNGARIPSRLVRLLSPHVELVPVCPEVEIGLGVPRAPIRLVTGDVGEPALVQPSTGRDLTGRMRDWARGFLGSAEPVDGALLKSRSPSCGIRDVKVYRAADDAAPIASRSGAFARELLRRHPLVPVEDEERLADPVLRHHYLTRVYARARLRRAAAEGLRGLRRFHAQYRPVLGAHSPSSRKALDRLLSDGGEGDMPGLGRRYEERFAEALAAPLAADGHGRTTDLAGDNPPAASDAAASGACFRPYPDALLDAGGGAGRSISGGTARR